MKKTFVETLDLLLTKNEELIFLTADLGFMAFEPLFEKYPKRFLNVGISEANMINIAGGLARKGKKVICYSMIPFIIHRCLEQLKIQLACSQDLSITIIGAGSGFTYGPQGSSHHAIEDIGIMRSIPGIEIYAPGTPEEIFQALNDTVTSKPCASYIRLGWTSNQIEELAINQINNKESKTLVISYGSALGCTVTGCEKLPVNILSLFKLSGNLWSEIKADIIKYQNIILIEPNVEKGGVAEYLMAKFFKDKVQVNFESINFDFEYAKLSASKSHYEHINGQSPESIKKKVEELINLWN